jgi:hypothetical protein
MPAVFFRGTQRSIVLVCIGKFALRIIVIDQDLKVLLWEYVSIAISPPA